MTNVASGTVVALHRCPGHRLPMVPGKNMELIVNLGVRDDRHALPDSSRQVLLIERETLDQLGLLPGQVKENITTKGIRLASLAHGSSLRIGNSVILEITKPCSPCSRMEEIRPGLIGELAGRRGMLARVVQGGVISQGDPITIGER